MKKIFAISFLSVFAVVGLARAEYNGFYASGTTDTSKNYNLASVNYVKGRYDAAVREAQQLVVTSDKQTTVDGAKWYPGFEGSDSAAPTIKYMENSIAEAVADVDTSGLVPKEDVIPDTELMQQVAVDVQSGATISESQAEAMQSDVPSVGAVAGSFVPNVATYYDYTGGNNGSDNLEPGDYVLTVTVDQSGNKVYVWRAMNISASRTTVSGYVGPG